MDNEINPIIRLMYYIYLDHLPNYGTAKDKGAMEFLNKMQWYFKVVTWQDAKEWLTNLINEAAKQSREGTYHEQGMQDTASTISAKRGLP